MGSSKFTGFKNQQATNGLVIVWRLVQLFSGQAWDCTQLILRCCAVGNLSTRQENGHGDSTSALEGAPNDKVSTWAHLEGSNECLTCPPLVSAGSFKLVCGRDKTWFWHSNIRLFAMVLVQLISFTVCIYTYIYIYVCIFYAQIRAHKKRRYINKAANHITDLNWVQKRRNGMLHVFWFNNIIDIILQHSRIKDCKLGTRQYTVSNNKLNKTSHEQRSCCEYSWGHKLYDGPKSAWVWIVSWQPCPWLGGHPRAAH